MGFHSATSYCFAANFLFDRYEKPLCRERMNFQSHWKSLLEKSRCECQKEATGCKHHLWKRIMKEVIILTLKIVCFWRWGKLYFNEKYIDVLCSFLFESCIFVRSVRALFMFWVNAFKWTKTIVLFGLWNSWITVQDLSRLDMVVS